jgi:hypothetical protein
MFNNKYCKLQRLTFLCLVLCVLCTCGSGSGNAPTLAVSGAPSANTTITVTSGCAGSSPKWTCAANSTAAEINACITSATSGDTINVSAGTGTWETEVIIPATKTIHLVGAGADLTKISFSGSAISSSSADSTISGFWFYKTGANSTAMITVKNKGFRVHHNKLE